MNYPKISTATVIDDHTLLVEFDNKAKRSYDVRHLLEKEPFSPLKNYSFFKAVKVDAGGYAVYWNEDIDLSEYEIWSKGKPV